MDSTTDRDIELAKRKPHATDLRIIKKYKTNGQIKHSVLLNYKEIMMQLSKIKIKYKTKKNLVIPTIDFNWLNKVNLRTA